MRCVQLAGERAGDHDQSIGISIHVALSCWQSWSRGSQRPFSCASFCRVLRFHHREQLCFHWRAESGACAAARSRLVFVYADDYLLEQPVRSKDPRTMAASPAQCLLAMPVHLSHVLCPFVLVCTGSVVCLPVARLVTSRLAALVKHLSRCATMKGRVQWACTHMVCRLGAVRSCRGGREHVPSRLSPPRMMTARSLGGWPGVAGHHFSSEIPAKSG